jgi:hypothetical protein
MATLYLCLRLPTIPSVYSGLLYSSDSCDLNFSVRQHFQFRIKQLYAIYASYAFR